VEISVRIDWLVVSKHPKIAKANAGPSAWAFEEMLEKNIKAEFPNADVTVELGVGDLVVVSGVEDAGAVKKRIAEIRAEVFANDVWLVKAY
jgi:hypothetical protein